MASYRAYVYCDKCNQPLRKNEYRREVSSTSQGVSVAYYCRICNSLARKPFSMAVWAFVVLLTFLMASVAAEMLSELNNTVFDSDNKPLLVFAVVAFPLGYSAYGLWKKSKCKPIYDRYVHNYGSDPENWPDAPRLYRTPEKPKSPKWGNMSRRQRIAFLALLVVSILVCALIWYDNYKSGLF